MILKNDEIIFNSGRHEYCFSGIIGLSPDNELSYGYDGTFEGKEAPEDDYRSYEGLSKEEQVEIADFMINRWNEFRKTLV
jgi:hypothetical protein